MTRAKRPVEWKPGQPAPAGFVLAKDGIPARQQGRWAQDKLRFLEEYLPPAIGATKKKAGQTFYLDLFAGPGRNASRSGGVLVDFPGSPIIALGATFRFRDELNPRGFGAFHFCNVHPADDAFLRLRVAAKLAQLGGRVDPAQVHFHLTDSNHAVHDILATIPSWAYLVVFADIEGPADLSFETIRALHRFHQSVDLYALYPSGSGMDRLFEYDDQGRRKYKRTLDDYFGTREWDEIVSGRITSGQSHDMKARLLGLYQRQLRSIWKEVRVLRVVRKQNRQLYHMLFANDHLAATQIAASANRRSDQWGLLDELG